MTTIKLPAMEWFCHGANGKGHCVLIAEIQIMSNSPDIAIPLAEGRSENYWN